MKKINLKKYDRELPIYRLETGEEVVGQEIDSDNSLIYIIKDGVRLRAALARNERVSSGMLHKTKNVIIKTSVAGTN